MSQPRRHGGGAARLYYRLLLLTYPPEFRREDGADAAALFAEACRESFRAGGVGQVLRRLLRALVDVPRGGFEARLSAGRELAWRSAGLRRRTRAARRAPGPPSTGRGLGSDLRFAIQSLRRRPAYAATVLAVLTMGIGATTTLFTIVDAVLLRPLDLPGSESLVEVRIHGVNPEGGWEWSSSRVRADVLDAWRQGAAPVEGFVAVNDSGLDNIFYLTGTDEPERLRGALVSSDFFRTLGAQAALGRVFGPGDDPNLLRRAAVISDGLFRRRFAGDPAVLRTAVLLNDEPFQVVGVMGPGFRIYDPASRIIPGEKVEIWVPLEALPEDALRAAQMRGQTNYDTVIARLRPGVDPATAAAALQAIRDRVALPDPAQRETVHLVRLRERMVETARAPLALLSGAVALLLALSCVNVAGVQLARTAERGSELALRVALGAGRARLVRLVVSEALLLALLAGGLAWIAARAAVGLVVALAGSTLPRADEAVVDLRVLLFAFAVSAGSGALSALVPAWHASAQDPAIGLGSGRASSASPRTRRLQSSVLAVQVALATLLLVGGALLVRTMGALHDVDPGIDPEDVVALDLYRSRQRYRGDPAAIGRYQDQVLAAVHRLPGVQSAALATSPPFRPGRDFYQREWRLRMVSTDYFRLLRQPIVRGRGFTASDTVDGEPVVVINETLARARFGDEDPLGKRLREVGDERPGPLIVGVAADARHESIDQEPLAAAYQSLEQSPVYRATLLVRTAGDPAALVASLRTAIWGIDPEQPIERVITLQAQLQGSRALVVRALYMKLVGLFALAALALTLTGIYGVVARTVAQRTREIGVRLALGATHARVVRGTVWSGLAPIAAGIPAGVLASLLGGRWLASFLFGVPPHDPVTLLTVAGIVGGSCVVAAWATARRATSVHPGEALRAE